MLQRLLPGGRTQRNPVSPPPVGAEAKRTQKVEFLRAIDIFRDLAPDEVAAVERSTRMSTMPKGRVLYHQGDTAQGLFLLKQGKIRLSQYTASGKKLDLAILEPGTFFGEMPMLGVRRRHASAEAVEDCLVCVMSEADIERLVLSRPQVALRMLEVMGHRLAEAEDQLQDLAYRTVPARLAAVLLRLASASDQLIEGISHQELGDMVGAYRETVTKVLDEFQAAGYVELGRRRIRLLDRDGLTKALDE